MKKILRILAFVCFSSSVTQTFALPQELLARFGTNSNERVLNAIEAIKRGDLVILVDDDDREN